jgi:hypothetical protein
MSVTPLISSSPLSLSLLFDVILSVTLLSLLPPCPCPFCALTASCSLSPQHTEMMLNAFISCSSETNAWTHYNIYRANTVLNCLSTSNTTPPPTSAPASESSPAKTQWDLPKPATFMTLCGLLWLAISPSLPPLFHSSELDIVKRSYISELPQC